MAGVIWMPGEPFMQPVDFSGREVMRFRTRGDGGQYSVMLLSGPDPAGPPPTVTFVAPEEWTQVEIRLEDFLTATPEIIAGLAFVAEGSVGGLGLRWMSWRLGDAANVSLSHAPCSVAGTRCVIFNDQRSDRGIWLSWTSIAAVPRYNARTSRFSSHGEAPRTTA